MAKIQFEETPNLIKIAERSLISERYVFIEAIRVLNFISPLQYEVLNAWYQFLATKIPKVDEVIYLRTTPLIALGRLRGRNRTEEDTVNKEYLELLHTLHENWLVQNRQGPLPFKLTIINQDLPLKEIDVELDKIVERLKQMP
jgi:thymidylate kinase